MSQGQQEGMTYAQTGVDYEAMDPFKRLCQQRAALTANNARRLGVKPVEWTRGESVYVVEICGRFYGHVEEGLGTKNRVAELFRQLMLTAQGVSTVTGKTYYDHIAQDTAAMILNDMSPLGISPISLAMHVAVGHGDWFKDEARVKDLIEGWGKACDLAKCIWGGGETPTLKGIVMPETAVLSGSAFGIAKHELLDPKNIEGGDTIVLLESSGIHANGLTLAREIADKLPEGYATKLSDGRMYGEALLDPTHIYCDFIEECLDYGIDIHYGVNITGHGWRKLMRAQQPFKYVIEHLPAQRPIFDFIQKQGPVGDLEAYGNLNMGAGFALFINKEHRGKFKEMYHYFDRPRRFASIIAGRVETSNKKQVVIEPKGLIYEGKTLAVR